MRKQTVKDFDVVGKKVLVRVDFNEIQAYMSERKSDRQKSTR